MIRLISLSRYQAISDCPFDIPEILQGGYYIPADEPSERLAY